MAVPSQSSSRASGDDRPLPAMSVVLATPGDYQTIRTTISYLRQQTVRDRLELVIVAASRAQLAADETELADFAQYQIIEVEAVLSVGGANMHGVRQAKAPIVVLAEDHAFPRPDWAAELIRAHEGPWAAVGPGIANANPSTVVSWADLFIGYGPWVVPAAAREAEFLPGHNSSYKRDVLLAYGDELEAMLQTETLLHWDLRAKGHRLYFEPAAVVAHTNFSLWSSWLRTQFHDPRSFAAERRRGKSLWWRCVYIFGSPLIPFVRFARIVRQRRRGLLFPFLRSLPALAIGLAMDGLGQWVGYAFGAGDAAEQVPKYEFHRIRHVTEHDRRTVFLPPSDSTASDSSASDSAASDSDGRAAARADS